MIKYCIKKSYQSVNLNEQCMEARGITFVIFVVFKIKEFQRYTYTLKTGKLWHSNLKPKYP